MISGKHVDGTERATDEQGASSKRACLRYKTKRRNIVFQVQPDKKILISSRFSGNYAHPTFKAVHLSVFWGTRRHITRARINVLTKDAFESILLFFMKYYWIRSGWCETQRFFSSYQEITYRVLSMFFDRNKCRFRHHIIKVKLCLFVCRGTWLIELVENCSCDRHSFF